MDDDPNFLHAKSLSPLLETAFRAARAAGDIIRSGQTRLQEVEEKGVGDLVSQVDRDADAAAVEVIRQVSDWPILSEELHPDQESVDSMWVVDPLDASSAFLMQAGPQYPAVLIAAREKDETSIGVAHFPLTGEWFYAVRGRGAWRNGKRVICEPTENLKTVWVEMNQYGNADWETDFFRRLRNQLRSAEGARLVTTNVPHSGVAMRIATGESPLAAAIHDNDARNVKQGPWDIAAPQLFLEEAGGVFLNPRGERTSPFSADPIIVARSRQLAYRILDLLQQPSAQP